MCNLALDKVIAVSDYERHNWGRNPEKGESPFRLSIMIGVEVVRLEPQGFVKIGDGLVVLASLDPHLAAIEVGSGTLRIEAKSPIEIGEGLVVVAPDSKDKATTTVEFRPPRQVDYPSRVDGRAFLP